MFRTKASRESHKIEARFRSQAEKAYEKYKIAKEIEETQKAKQLIEKEKVEEVYTDAMGMYIIDTGKRKKEPVSETTSAQLSDSIRESVMNGFTRFIRNMYTDVKFELKWKEFMCITFYLQMPLSYMINHISMVYKWGALLVIIVYLLIGAFIAMPVYMLLMFMGNYGRRSYIRFWECVPVLKGVAYSIAFTIVLQEIFNVTFASLCLDYILDILTSKTLPWSNCTFVRSSNDCVFKPLAEQIKGRCCLRYEPNCDPGVWRQTVFKYAAYDYFQSNQLKAAYGHSTLSQYLALHMLIIIGILWLMILLMMLIGLRKFRFIMTTINIVILLLVFVPFFTITLYMNNFNMFPEFESNYMSLLDYKFWLEVSLYSLHRELAGDVITFSAISSPGISTGMDTVCIYTMKFMFLMLLTVWTSIGLTILQQHYTVLNTKCIHVDVAIELEMIGILTGRPVHTRNIFMKFFFEGFAVLYGVFPEIISSLPLAKPILLVYFIILFYWCFSVTVYTLNSFIGALLEEFPKLIKFKVILCFLFCSACGTLNLFIAKSDIERLYEIWFTQSYTQMKIVLLFFTLVGIYLYTMNRLSNDYHFTYGKKLNPFWIHGAKVAMLLVTVIGTLRLSLNYLTFRRIEDIIMPIFTLIPIICGALIVFIKYKSGLRKTVINSDPRWGPPNIKDKLARNKFDPKRELRYKSALQKCEHNCLLNSMTLSREIKYWRNKRKAQYQVDME